MAKAFYSFHYESDVFRVGKSGAWPGHCHQCPDLERRLQASLRIALPD